MTRLTGILLVLLVWTRSHLCVVASPCVTGDFFLTVQNAPSCNYTTLLTAFTAFYDDPMNVPPDGPCTSVTAEQALWQLLQVSDAASAQKSVNALCAKAYSNYDKNVVELDQIVKGSGNSQEANSNFVKNFYLGRTDWNEQYETLYGSTPTGINYTNVLMDDGAVIDAEYSAAGRYGKIVFPDKLPEFSKCQANSVYCCWTSDRQPNDNNGNCQVSVAP